MLDHKPLHLNDFLEACLDALAAGHRNRRCNELDMGRVAGRVPGDFAGERGARGEDSGVGEDQALVAAIGLKAPESIDKGGVFGVENPGAEYYREGVVHGEILLPY